MHGEDLNLEKFSRLLADHLAALQNRAAFVSLWFFNLHDMTRSENIEHMRRVLAVGFRLDLRIAFMTPCIPSLKRMV